MHLGLQDWKDYLFTPDGDISLVDKDAFTRLLTVWTDDELIFPAWNSDNKFMNLIINGEEVSVLRATNTISILESLDKEWVTQITSDNVFGVSYEALQIIGPESE